MLSGALVAGVVADAILGAFVVYSKLNPYLVSLHLVVSLAMVAIGTLLYHHSKYLYGPSTRADVRDPYFRKLGRWLWLPVCRPRDHGHRDDRLGAARRVLAGSARRSAAALGVLFGRLGPLARRAYSSSASSSVSCSQSGRPTRQRPSRSA